MAMSPGYQLVSGSTIIQFDTNGQDAAINMSGYSYVSLRRALIIITITVMYCVNGARTDEKLCFADRFAFGVATSAYQIEGAWNVSDKGESIWDRYIHEHPERVFDHQNGDVADDSFHKFKEDVELMSKLGLNFYRFSISWPRILPTGLNNYVNGRAIGYYKALLKELSLKKIFPIVTMYHWDLPQSLQDIGGWTNPVVADYFVDYARVLLDNFGFAVKFWITFNDPLTFCHNGYGGDDAPGGRSSGFQDYMCGHNVLRAHGMVFRMFQNEYQTRTSGYMGIALGMAWMEPATTSEDDRVAAEIARQFTFGWFANPILSKAGDYPPIMRRRIDVHSRTQGFHRSRLPSFTAQEIDTIRDSYDFLGFNHYTTYLVAKRSSKITQTPSFEDDANVDIYQKDEWPKSNSTWLKVVPWGFRKALNWIKTTYNNPTIIVTENGISSEASLQDKKRLNYIDAYLRALHSAIVLDKCRVVGYAYWSLIDNYEWMRGYSERFGLYEVDYTSPNRTRTARLSASYFSEVARTRCLPPLYDKDVYDIV